MFLRYIIFSYVLKYTALKIASLKANTQVTLVDSKENFIFLPLLYELSIGTANLLEVAPRYSDILQNTNIRYVKGSVTNINFIEKSAEIGNGTSEITFDDAVIAVGAKPRIDFIPGGEQYSIPFYSINDAFNLRRKMDLLKRSNKSNIRIAVIGGGYSGVEVATSIVYNIGKERAKVMIIDRNSMILKASPDHNRITAEK